jgi:hypothetical protein
MKNTSFWKEIEQRNENDAFKAISKLINNAGFISSPIYKEINVNGKKYDVTILISEHN